ncbi:MAG: hypothetical protein ABF753_02835 [Lentilactobacillus hilgardii]|uniref:hypothetical protein n=1 Tax=Lentilactobacillus hilgardii TaxID=1588 RepID=UPI0039E97C4F
MNAKRIEQQSLNRGVIINILMGSAGMLVYAFTHLEALFLDASFVLIECQGQFKNVGFRQKEM